MGTVTLTQITSCFTVKRKNESVYKGIKSQFEHGYDTKNSRYIDKQVSSKSTSCLFGFNLDYSYWNCTYKNGLFESKIDTFLIDAKHNLI